MSKPISQREARALRRRVRELTEQLRTQRMSWRREWPGAICILSEEADKTTYAKVETALRLKHAVVVTASQGRLYYHADPLPD